MKKWPWERTFTKIKFFPRFMFRYKKLNCNNISEFWNCKSGKRDKNEKISCFLEFRIFGPRVLIVPHLISCRKVTHFDILNCCSPAPIFSPGKWETRTRANLGFSAGEKRPPRVAVNARSRPKIGQTRPFSMPKSGPAGEIGQKLFLAAGQGKEKANRQNGKWVHAKNSKNCTHPAKASLNPYNMYHISALQIWKAENSQILKLGVLKLPPGRKLRY